jgi:hypothetical protein
MDKLWVHNARNAVSAADAFNVCLEAVRDVLAQAKSDEAIMALRCAHSLLFCAACLCEAEDDAQTALERCRKETKTTTEE